MRETLVHIRYDGPSDVDLALALGSILKTFHCAAQVSSRPQEGLPKLVIRYSGTLDEALGGVLNIVLDALDYELWASGYNFKTDERTLSYERLP